jgi:hypothetical protein
VPLPLRLFWRWTKGNNVKKTAFRWSPIEKIGLFSSEKIERVVKEKECSSDFHKPHFVRVTSFNYRTLDRQLFG